MLLLIIFIGLALATDISLIILLAWPWWLAMIMFVVFTCGYMVLYLLICWLFAIFIPKNDTRPPRKVYTAITYITCRFLIIMYRLKIVVIGKELFKDIPVFLFLSNHQSNLDPICQIASYKRPELTYIMKDSIMRLPMVGNWLNSAGHLPLDRKNNRNAIITINKSVIRIEQGFPIGAYPEGTRSKSKVLGEFRDGLFKVAVKSHTPIVVTIIDNAYKVKSRFPFRRTKIFLKVCRVIEYEEYKDMNTHQLSAVVRNIMADELKMAREANDWLE